MDFTNESFEVVVDKGTLDALMSDQREEVFLFLLIFFFCSTKTFKSK